VKEEYLVKRRDYTAEDIKADAVVGKIHSFDLSSMTVYKLGMCLHCRMSDTKNGKILWSVKANESVLQG
jgi:hypothetical protein